MLLVGQNGEPVNQQVLPFVGLPVSLKGKLEKLADLYVLRININDISLS